MNTMISLSEMLKTQIEASKSFLPESTSKFIRMEAGKFVDNIGGTSNFIEGIILDFIQVNSFYKSAFNPAVKQIPICVAIGLDEMTDLKPIKESTMPQHGGTCGTCPHNAWGSGSGKGKRCKNSYRVAIIPVGETSPQAVKILNVPPASMANLGNYVRSLRATNRWLPMVVTRVAFDQSTTYAKLTFTETRPADNLNALNAAYQEAQTLLREPYGLKDA